jgi:sugar-specific transcriptional regulator TrmB
VAGLGEETIKKVLKNSGLTEKEAEVYIFLAKREALKSGEIAKLMKKDKAQVFRILKSLQTKGLVESTLEFPTRFTAVPFEIVLESSIKAKQEEVAFIEKAKKDLLSYLKDRRRAELGLSLEKFVVIEGNNKIYPKISQMVRETKNQFSVIATIQDLVRADQFGILGDAFSHPLKSQIQFRFLTELSEQNLTATKAILKKAPKAGFNVKVRNPDLGLRLFPRMVVRDEEEILFFITPRTDKTKKNDVCFWTNCKSLVKAFTTVFEDLWRNSTDIQKKIVEIETGKPTPETCIIKDTQIAHKKYIDTMRSAEREIIMMTSSEGLIRSWKNMPLLKEWAERGVSTRIMAPITSENLQAAQELSKFCAVRHVPTSYLGTTIVDGKHLFQFKEPPPEQAKSKTIAYFENTFYTNDFDYVEKTKNMLNDIWKSAHTPSAVTLRSIIRRPAPAMSPPETVNRDSKRILRKMSYVTLIEDAKASEAITEKDVLHKVISARKITAKDPLKDISRMYATIAQAIIHPPSCFNLPDIFFDAFHMEKQSSFGENDALIVSLWLKTANGYAFVPVAIVQDQGRPEPVSIWKASMAGTPAGQNIQLVKKDELQIRVHGNTVFAGWTVPIQLFPVPYRLPPSCILFEGYGSAKAETWTSVLPSGYRNKVECNSFEAFVTFMHPESKYEGPGTEGILLRDCIMDTYPPSTARENS